CAETRPAVRKGQRRSNRGRFKESGCCQRNRTGNPPPAGWHPTFVHFAACILLWPLPVSRSGKIWLLQAVASGELPSTWGLFTRRCGEYTKSPSAIFAAKWFLSGGS